jgi:hypothetical protein
MRKLLLVLVFLVIVVSLSACSISYREGGDSRYNVQVMHDQNYTVYSAFKDDLDIILRTNEQIWNSNYISITDTHNYLFKGSEVKNISITYQGTLRIAFTDGRVTFIYNYVSITFGD